jgi:hypothetical protein
VGDTSDNYLDELDPFFPPYLLPNSPAADKWSYENPNGWRIDAPAAPVLQQQQQQLYVPDVHKAAAAGDMVQLWKMKKREWSRVDFNGWQPIHEAARSGHTAIVKMFVNSGIDVNVRTGHEGEGESPLTLALEFWGENHDLVKYLRDLGAIEYDYESDM